MTDHGELEVRVHGALRALPPPRAPETLLPRVMEAVRRRAVQPWYERAWLTWPLGWRAASGLALALVILGLAWWLPSLGAAAVHELSRLAGDWPAQISRTVAQIAAAAGAAELVLRAILVPTLGGLVALLALASMACAAAGAALGRVTTERMS
jgi:hypothetical protein